MNFLLSLFLRVKEFNLRGGFAKRGRIVLSFGLEYHRDRGRWYHKKSGRYSRISKFLDYMLDIAADNQDAENRRLKMNSEPAEICYTEPKKVICG